MSEELECPECHAPIAPDDFLCESCQLLLNPQLASGEYVISEPSIVRALMSPPTRTSSREIPAVSAGTSAHDLETVRFGVPIGDDEVPYLTAGIDIALRPLHPFEAYVASFIDGTQSVAALAQATKLPVIEIKVVLKGLIERRMVELHHQPASRPPEDDLPLIEGTEFLEEAEPPPPPPEARRAEPPLPRIPLSFPPTPPPVKPLTVPQVPPAARPAQRSGSTVSRPLDPPAAPQPPARSEDFLQRAVRFEREGQVDRAIELLKKGLAQVTAPAPLYNKLALILVDQRKDFTQAAELLERAVELEPQNPVFQQNLRLVVGLAASAPPSRKEPKRGLLSRITGRS
jgi:hypothetical protein